MKSVSDFPICTLTPEQVKQVTREISVKELTLEDYYALDDSTSSLERVREYQLQEILGRYKLF